jgi:hypothetical protein
VTPVGTSAIVARSCAGVGTVIEAESMMPPRCVSSSPSQQP